jgi:hypothetical protein
MRRLRLHSFGKQTVSREIVRGPSDRQRRLPAADCWRLYYQDGLPLRQVAALLGCTHEGVRWRLLADGGTLRGRGDRSGSRR